MNQVEQVREKIQKEIEKMANQLTAAYSSYVILKQITTWYNENDDYAEIISKSITFWGMVKYSMATQLVLDLTNIYDVHRDTVNLGHLVERVKKNPSVFPTEKLRDSLNMRTSKRVQICVPNDVQGIIEKTEKLLEGVRVEIDKLRTYRNKQLAHTDLDVLLKQEMVSNLTWEEINLLMEIAMEIINSISVALTDKSYVFELLYSDDLKYMLDDAVKGKQKHIQKPHEG